MNNFIHVKPPDDEWHLVETYLDANNKFNNLRVVGILIFMLAPHIFTIRAMKLVKLVEIHLWHFDICFFYLY